MQENQVEIEAFFDKKTGKIIDAIRFALKEDAKMEYLIYYYAPFTGGDECVVPKGTEFVVTGPMRDDAFYIRRVGERVYDDLNLILVRNAKEKEDEKWFKRLGGFSFFITEEQIMNLPLEFQSGSRDVLLSIISYMKHKWQTVRQ